MTTIKLNEAARKRVEEDIEAERAAGDPQVAADKEMLLKLHDEVHALGKRETHEGRVNRLVAALNSALMLVPGRRIVSHGTRVEVREANGHYHDPGLDAVAEFHKAFDAHIATEPGVPEFKERARRAIQDYLHQAAALGEALKALAQAARDDGDGDEGGALLLIRLQLCQEELAELAEAMLDRDIVGCLDALCDMTYVGDGTYLSLGLGHYKLAGLMEVHRSNMSKMGPDGKPITSSAGRIVKGPGYSPPNLRAVLGLPSTSIFQVEGGMVNGEPALPAGGGNEPPLKDGWYYLLDNGNPDGVGPFNTRELAEKAGRHTLLYNHREDGEFGEGATIRVEVE